jgi:hypothetical protein
MTQGTGTPPQPIPKLQVGNVQPMVSFPETAGRPADTSVAAAKYFADHPQTQTATAEAPPSQAAEGTPKAASIEVSAGSGPKPKVFSWEMPEYIRLTTKAGKSPVEAAKMIEAQRAMTQRWGMPATTAETPAAGTITPEAQQLLKTAEKGMPGFVSQNLRKIAQENGISVAGDTTPADIINALKQKVAATPAAATPPETTPAPIAPAAPPSTPAPVPHSGEPVGDFVKGMMDLGYTPSEATQAYRWVKDKVPFDQILARLQAARKLQAANPAIGALPSNMEVGRAVTERNQSGRWRP